MGRKRDHAIEKLRKNQKNVRFDEINSILISLGCAVRKKGSHFTYTYPGQKPITVPYRKPFILEIYVKEIIQMIEAIEDEEE